MGRLVLIEMECSYLLAYSLTDMERHCQAVMSKQRNTRTGLWNEAIGVVTRREVCNRDDAKR